MSPLSNIPFSNIPKEILFFAANYCTSFNQLDPAAVASAYAIPSGIAQGGQYFHFANHAAVLANMQTLCTHYQSTGFTSASYEITHFLPQGNQHALLRLSWQIALANHFPSQQFATDYNMINTPDGWRILLCSAFEEKFS